jgi:hypothetical protein
MKGLSDDDFSSDDVLCSDDDFSRELTRALQDVSPLAARIAARAKDSFAWRTVDNDLLFAEISFDSSLETTSGLRADPRAASPSSRVLVFTALLQAGSLQAGSLQSGSESGLRSVEVEVLSDRLVGQFIPPGPGTVAVENEQGDVINRVAADEQGFFIIEPAPNEPIRLHCESGNTRIISAWIRLQIDS